MGFRKKKDKDKGQQKTDNGTGTKKTIKFRQISGSPDLGRVYIDDNSGRIFVEMQEREWSPWVNFLRRCYRDDTIPLDSFAQQFGILMAQGYLEGVFAIVEPEHLSLGIRNKHEQFYGLSEIKKDAELEEEVERLREETDRLYRVEESYNKLKPDWQKKHDENKNLSKKLAKAEQQLGDFKGSVKDLEDELKQYRTESDSLKTSKEELEAKLERYTTLNAPPGFNDWIETLGLTEKKYESRMKDVSEEERPGYYIWVMFSMFAHFQSLYKDLLKRRGG